MYLTEDVDVDDVGLYDYLRVAKALICKYATGSQHYLKDNEDCEAYIATAIMQAHRSYDPEKGKLSTWLITKARWSLVNFQRDYYRLHPMTSGQTSNVEYLDHINEPYDDEAETDMDTIVSMAHELLQFHLLTPMVRMYMELHYICGWTGKKIADVLGVNVRNVHQQIINGRKRLIEFAIDDDMRERFYNCYLEKP